jgi:hypothetical protein
MFVPVARARRARSRVDDRPARYARAPIMLLLGFQVKTCGWVFEQDRSLRFQWPATTRPARREWTDHRGSGQPHNAEDSMPHTTAVHRQPTAHSQCQTTTTMSDKNCKHSAAVAESPESYDWPSFHQNIENQILAEITS